MKIYKNNLILMYQVIKIVIKSKIIFLIYFK
jgi:hypothetical protein